MDAATAPRPAWFIEPENRATIGGLFLLVPHVVIPAISSQLVALIVSSGWRSAGLGLLFLLNSLFWGVAIAGAQALILRRYVAAISWFGLTLAGIVAAIVVDFVITQILIAMLGIESLTYYRYGLPILRWLLISVSQWLVLRWLVRSAELWIAASVFGAILFVVLQSALMASGNTAMLMFPAGGLILGLAQTWCLLQFTRREAIPAPAAPQA